MSSHSENEQLKGNCTSSCCVAATFKIHAGFMDTISMYRCKLIMNYAMKFIWKKDLNAHRPGVASKHQLQYIAYM